ncbi:hypothetical protein SLEP1_g55066 [Rubroshorea leprosula]|uniref:Uncharacterized protein n=1 Tax=Rubroshorea leprosula TaxID=152421 RepID=A0AAV5MFD8_9ROSI|nr:hypothetical protein SLEP1_g55066 [Rubroshorea leprosula]
MWHPGEVPMDFVPQPLPVDLDPKLWEVGVVTDGKGKSTVPLPVQKSSFYEASNSNTVKRFINSTFSQVDLNRARDKVNAHGKVGVVH